MENVVNTRHRILDRLRVANITNVKLNFFCSFRMPSLKLMTHIILLFLVTREDTNFFEIRIKEVSQNSRSKRASTTSDHKCCVIKNFVFHILYSSYSFFNVYHLTYKCLMRFFPLINIIVNNTPKPVKQMLYFILYRSFGKLKFN